MILVHKPIDVVEHTDLFPSDGAALHTWNKSHLVFVKILFICSWIWFTNILSKILTYKFIRNRLPAKMEM